MYKEIVEKVKPELDKAFDFYSREIAKIRTGQASPSLVEDVGVDISGQHMLLKQLAGISCPERRSILIQPWDISYLGPIEKAISKSEIGIQPIVDKEAIRISLPPLSREFRENLAKVLSEKTEESRKMIRRKREDAWNEIQEKARKKEMSEDDKFKGKEELQKVIDEYQKKIETAEERKQQEIMTE